MWELTSLNQNTIDNSSFNSANENLTSQFALFLMDLLFDSVSNSIVSSNSIGHSRIALLIIPEIIYLFYQCHNAGPELALGSRNNCNNACTVVNPWRSLFMNLVNTV